MNTRFLARLERLIDARIRLREAVVTHASLVHADVVRVGREVDERQALLVAEVRLLDDGTSASILHALAARADGAPVDLASAIADASIATFGALVRDNLDAATLAFLTCGATRRGFLLRFSQDEPPSSRNVH